MWGRGVILGLLLLYPRPLPPTPFHIHSLLPPNQPSQEISSQITYNAGTIRVSRDLRGFRMSPSTLRILSLDLNDIPGLKWALHHPLGGPKSCYLDNLEFLFSSYKMGLNIPLWNITDGIIWDHLLLRKYRLSACVGQVLRMKDTATSLQPLQGHCRHILGVQ